MLSQQMQVFLQVAECGSFTKAARRLLVTPASVMKHINKLTERQYIAVERTSYIDNNGMKWNGNNLYTILPIQRAADVFHQRQLAELELAAERQRVVKLLREQESPA